MAYKYKLSYADHTNSANANVSAINLNVGSANGTAVNPGLTAATTLTLLGRNFSSNATASDGSDTIVYGFGHYVNQNFVDLLNNGAKTKTAWENVNANLVQGQLLTVTSQTTPVRTNRLYMASTSNVTFANAANLTHSTGGLIEVFTEVNPPANMKGWLANGTTSDFTIDYANGGNIIANVIGNSNIATFTPTGVVLGNATTRVSDLNVANGNISVTGNVAVSNTLVISNITANTSNTIAITANAVTITGNGGNADTHALTVTGGNIVVQKNNLLYPVYAKVSSPYVEGTIASFKYANGDPSPNAQPIDQPQIKNVGVLGDLYVGSGDPAAGGGQDAANYSANTLLANVKITSDGNITANGNLSLQKFDSTGTPMTSGGANVYGFIFADGAYISNIQAGAIGGGTIENANYARYGGNITIGAQPNITSLGTLTTLSIAGNLTMSGTGNITAGNISVANKLITDVLVANTFLPDTVNAQVGMVSPVFSSGSNTTSAILTGRFVMSQDSFFNLAYNNNTMYIERISTSGSGATGNFFSPGAGGGWTFDSRLTLMNGLKFDDGTGNPSNLTTTGSEVNMFRSVLTDLNLGTQAANILMGSSTAGADTTIRSNLTVNQDTILGGDVWTTSASIKIANATSTTVNFAGAATTLNMGAATGTTTVKNNLTVNGNISANADIFTTQATVNVLNANASTINFAGAATALTMGATTGTTKVQNDLVVTSGNIYVDAGVTSANLLTTEATTVAFASAADTITIGNANSSGQTMLKSGTIVGTQSTQNLWNTVATTINFGNAAATLNVGKSNSILNLRASTIVGTSSQTTVNLWNANTTAINFGGAADTISIGNTSSTAGTTTVNHGLTVSGKAVFNANVVMDLGGYVPATSFSAGIKGQIAYDASYVYICVATNTWKRSPLSTW